MNKLSYFKIGLFVIAATVIAVIGVVVLGVGTFLQKQTLVETYIDESVQGLDVGSAVKFRGVLVGKVEQITLTSVEYSTRRRYVLVRVGLSPNMFQFPLTDAKNPSFMTEIEKGLRVRLAAQGLTGTAYLEADYQDPTRNPPLEIDWQPSYPYIPSARSKITQLSESVDRILQNIEKIDVGRLVEGLEKSLATITKVAEGANLDKISTQANAFVSEVRETNRQFKDLLGGAEVKSALTDAAAAAETARRIIGSAEKPMTQLLADLPQASESINRLVKRLDSASGDLPDSTAQLRQTLRRLNRLLASQQQEMQTTVENLRTISENVKEITDNSTRYPSQVLFGAPPPKSDAIGK
jgi:phospholipid/cholesterol/gamma-HCH transport system substrate-binding protein/paraquat-inducible protein B